MQGGNQLLLDVGEVVVVELANIGRDDADRPRLAVAGHQPALAVDDQPPRRLQLPPVCDVGCGGLFVVLALPDLHVAEASQQDRERADDARLEDERAPGNEELIHPPVRGAVRFLARLAARGIVLKSLLLSVPAEQHRDRYPGRYDRRYGRERSGGAAAQGAREECQRWHENRVQKRLQEDQSNDGDQRDIADRAAPKQQQDYRVEEGCRHRQTRSGTSTGSGRSAARRRAQKCDRQQRQPVRAKGVKRQHVDQDAQPKRPRQALSRIGVRAPDKQ